jgi:hypothetical protein
MLPKKKLLSPLSRKDGKLRHREGNSLPEIPQLVLMKLGFKPRSPYSSTPTLSCFCDNYREIKVLGVG